jgi:hypothetical protein
VRARERDSERVRASTLIERSGRRGGGRAQGGSPPPAQGRPDVMVAHRACRRQAAGAGSDRRCNKSDVGNVCCVAACRSCVPTCSSCIGKRLAAVVLHWAAHDHIIVCISDCITYRVAARIGWVGKGQGNVVCAVRTQRYLDVFEPGKGTGRGGPYGR